MSIFHSLLLFLLVLFLSCNTTPKVPDAALMETAVPLDSGASVYIIADVQQARSILGLLPVEELKNRQAVMMLERTVTAAIALFPQESGRRFQIAAWGNYPSFRAGLAFSLNNDWKKLRSEAGQDYWYSETDGLSIALNARQAFVVSSAYKAPAVPAATSGVKIPEGFGEFRRGSPISCWLEEPSRLIDKMLNDSGIPIRIPAEKLFIVLFPEKEGQYEAVIRMVFENTAQARGMAAVFSLASNFAPDKSDSLLAAIFFAGQPVQNERSLDIKTPSLSEAEITQLFSLFL